MTKKEIVKQISEELDMTQLKVKEIVQMTFDAIIETLINDERHRIELRNFGVFEVKKRAARTARNPRTGESVKVPEKYVVTFKPGKEMEERVLEMERRELAALLAAEEEVQPSPTDTNPQTSTTPSAAPLSPQADQAHATPRSPAAPHAHDRPDEPKPLDPARHSFGSPYGTG